MKRKYVQAMMTGMAAMLAVTVPVTTVAAATPEKEQTVYVNADQNGNVEKVIVSNWLKNPAAGAFIIMPLSTIFTAVYSRGGVRGISSAEHAVVFIHLVNKSSREIQKIVESSTTCDRDGSL